MNAIENTQLPYGPGAFVPYREAIEHLVSVMQELSLARDLKTVMQIVRRAARELTGADGATFVLREGDLCHYADEDAISPLWKGQKFPMSICISGWVMLNREPAVIEDIYSDERIPAAAYEPTFVKSLVMVPIRTADPIGAIGNYWSRRCSPTPEVVKILRALADATSVVMENVKLYSDLERRVSERTAELRDVNRTLLEEIAERKRIEEELRSTNEELKQFAFVASYDLQEPLRKIMAFSDRLAVKCGDRLKETEADYIHRIQGAATRMRALLSALLSYSRVRTRTSPFVEVDLNEVVQDVVSDIEIALGQAEAHLDIGELPCLEGDAAQLRQLFQNLIGNAAKYRREGESPQIRITGQVENGTCEIVVKDNGIGFDDQYAERIFLPFERLHTRNAYEGTGLGLATCRRIVQRHGGAISARSRPGEGAAFTVTLPVRQPQST